MDQGCLCTPEGAPERNGSSTVPLQTTRGMSGSPIPFTSLTRAISSLCCFTGNLTLVPFGRHSQGFVRRHVCVLLLRILAAAVGNHDLSCRNLSNYPGKTGEGLQMCLMGVQRLVWSRGDAKWMISGFQTCHQHAALEAKKERGWNLTKGNSSSTTRSRRRPKSAPRRLRRRKPKSKPVRRRHT